MPSVVLFLLLIATLEKIQLPSEAARIVGGHLAEKNQFPHQVGLLKEGKLHCGGSIVSETWVLTAAHCLLNGGKPYPVQLLTILAGVLDLNDPNGQRLTVKRSYPHESFGNAFNDIGLVETAERFVFGSGVKAIPLRKTPLPDGTEMIISGWGRSGTLEPVSDKLQFVHMKSIPLKQCTDMVGITYNGIICIVASEPGEHGACNGDSGGPAVVDNELVGVANWVYLVCGNYPNGYANVTTFVGWVNDHIHASDYQQLA